MPTSIWVDTGLVDYATSVLTGGAAPPSEAALYTNNVALSPAETYAGLGVDSATELSALAGWTFALNAGHYATATQLFNFTFSPGQAGNVYYGICLFSSALNLWWYLPFPAPYTVPSGGGALTFQVTLSFSDCAYHP